MSGLRTERRSWPRKPLRSCRTAPGVPQNRTGCGETRKGSHRGLDRGGRRLGEILPTKPESHRIQKSCENVMRSLKLRSNEVDDRSRRRIELLREPAMPRGLRPGLGGDKKLEKACEPTKPESDRIQKSCKNVMRSLKLRSMRSMTAAAKEATCGANRGRLAALDPDSEVTRSSRKPANQRSRNVHENRELAKM